MTVADRQALVDSVMKHEGKRLLLYQDMGGAWTVGYGHNLSAKGISNRVADLMLEEDIDDALADAMTFDWFAGLNGVRQRVVTEMIFNLGLTKFRLFTATIRAIAEGDYAIAARQMRLSLWAKQVGARARTLAALMEAGS